MFFENRVETMSITEFSSFSFPVHLHHDVEIAICTEGSLLVQCNNQTKVLRRGDIMISFPNDIHSYSDEKYGKGIILIFNPNISETIENKINNCTYENFTFDETLISLFFKLNEIFSSDSLSLITYGYLHIILGYLLRKLPKSENHQLLETDLFSKALQYISLNYTKPITLKILSAHLGVSCHHLSRIFSKKIPGGFCEYLQLLRIEYAKKLLANTQKNVYEILLESGFSNQRTFNRVFKNISGLTPREYRRSQLKKGL